MVLCLAACANLKPIEPVSTDNGQAVRARLADRALHFSQLKAGHTPKIWQPFIIRQEKPKTTYQLVLDPIINKTVLFAQASLAASGLVHAVNVNPQHYPLLRWQWRVPALIADADVSVRHLDDSPARIVLGFDGDHSRLPLLERGKMELAELISGRAVPFASLVYVWDNRIPVGTVIDHPFSQRIKYIVAASGPNNLNEWRRFSRHLVADYTLAFGEPPGILLDIGVLTDSDNTASQTSAYYGDIDLLAD